MAVRDGDETKVGVFAFAGIVGRRENVGGRAAGPEPAPGGDRPRLGGSESRARRLEIHADRVDEPLLEKGNREVFAQPQGTPVGIGLAVRFTVPRALGGVFMGEFGEVKELPGMPLAEAVDGAVALHRVEAHEAGVLLPVRSADGPKGVPVAETHRREGPVEKDAGLGRLSVRGGRRGAAQDEASEDQERTIHGNRLQDRGGGVKQSLTAGGGARAVSRLGLGTVDAPRPPA